MFNQLLEYLHNPQWLRMVLLGALLILVVDGYLMPLLTKRKKKFPPSLDRQQFNQAIVQMAWSRSAANFYFVLSLIGIVLTYSSYVSNPNTRITLNLLVASAILYSFEKFRRALKIKRSLSI